VLTTAQTNAADNLIWVVAAGAWTRALDSDGARDLVTGTLVLVAPVSASEQFWALRTAGEIVPGTTALTWVQVEPSELAIRADLISTNPVLGDALITVDRTETNAVPRTLNFYVQKSKLMVALYTDPTVDTASQVATGLANAIADAKAGDKVLEFEPGATYTTNAETAFLGTYGLRDLQFWGNGCTIYRNSGAGPVLSLDSGSNTQENHTIEMVGFRLRGNASSTYGLDIRALSGARIHDVRAFDIATAGFNVRWAVSCDFRNWSVSSNDNTFAFTATKGLIVDRSSGANYTAACLFDNMRMEGFAAISDVGIELVYADLSNIFRGGASEAVPRGLRALSTSGRNRIEGMDFEQNTVYDISIAGKALTLRDINASSGGSSGTVIVESTAEGTTFDGGFVSWVALNSSSKSTRFGGGFKTSATASVGITGSTASSVPALGIHQRYGVARVDGNLAVTAYYPDIDGPEATWTPTAAQNGSVALTINTAESVVEGRFAKLSAKLTFTAAGTAGNQIVISGIPSGLAVKASWVTNLVPIGTFIFTDASVGFYAGVVLPLTSTTFGLYVDGVASSVGVTPNFAIANTDELRVSLDYPFA
jgi:hypothetical protein